MIFLGPTTYLHCTAESYTLLSNGPSILEWLDKNLQVGAVGCHFALFHASFGRHASHWIYWFGFHKSSIAMTDRYSHPSHERGDCGSYTFMWHCLYPPLLHALVCSAQHITAWMRGIGMYVMEMGQMIGFLNIPYDFYLTK